jgi:hypothetical protein
MQSGITGRLRRAPTGTAVVDHETNTVETIAYPGGGQPHGIAYLAPNGG